MNWVEASILFCSAACRGHGLGLPVAFAFLAHQRRRRLPVPRRRAGPGAARPQRVQSVTSFSLTPIPFFVLMGEVLFHTGLAIKAIDAFALLIRRVPGRLAVIAIVAGTVFSAISGSTIATTALLGSADAADHAGARLRAEAWRWGRSWAIGGVDMLIPPSALTVLLGSLAGISISGLLIGGIVPGLILSVHVRRLHHHARDHEPGAGAGRAARGAAPAGAARWLPFFIHVLPLLLDFRPRGRRDDGRLGDADRSGRARRRRHDRRRRRSIAA